MRDTIGPLAALYASINERIAEAHPTFAARHRARLEASADALRADGEALAWWTARDLVEANLERYRDADAAGEVVTAAHAVRQARWWDQVADVLDQNGTSSSLGAGGGGAETNGVSSFWGVA